LLIVSPDSQAPACPLSGRNSTYRAVRNCGATSQDIASLSDTFKQTLIAWLGSATNGIHQLFADIGNFQTVNTATTNTQKLCISKSDGGSVCVTGDQLAALLANQTTRKTQ